MRANQDIYSKQKSVLLYLLAIGAAFFLLALSITTADAQTVILKAGSDTGTITDDYITTNTTLTFTASGFPNNAVLNITASHATLSDVTASRTGNGDIQLGTLGAGEWKVEVTRQNILDHVYARFRIYIVSTDVTPLIGNFSSAGTGSIHVGGTSSDFRTKIAQGFTTGPNASTVEFLTLRIGNQHSVGSGDAGPVITIQGESSGEPDGNILGTATSVPYSEFDFRKRRTVQFSTPVGLAGSTKYFVVIELSTDRSIYFVNTDINSSPSFDSYSINGWSIKNTRQHFFGDPGEWGNLYGARMFKLLLQGTTETPVYATVLKDSSDTGDSDTDGITNDTTPTFTVSGFDANASVTVTVKAGGSAVATITGTGNGDYTVANSDALSSRSYTVEATDGTNAAPDITITVDTNPPPAIAASVATLTGHVAGADTYINKADRDAAAQALIATPTAVAGATYTYAIIGHTDTCDGSTGTFSATIPDTDTQTADGTYKLCITLADVAGNAVYRASSIFQIDTTVPTIGSYSGPSGNTAYGTASITFTPNEAGKLRANAACGIPETSIGGSYVNDVFNVPLTLDPGTYASCSFVIEDVAGNPSTAQTIASFTILAPTYTIDLKVSSDSGTSNTDNITNDDTPTFTVSGLDNSATVTVTATHTDNTEESHTRNGNGDVTFPSSKSLKDGVWSVVASDGTNTTAALSVTIDTTAPPAIVSGATTLVGHAADGYVTKAEDDAAAGALVATPTAVAGATFRYIVVRTALDSNCANYPTGVWTSTTIPTTSSLGADAPYKICIRLRDVAGNAVFSETSAFKKDTVVPTISSVTAPSGTVITSTPTLTFTSSEAGETRANAACNIEAGITVIAGVNTLTFPPLTNKAYSCSFVIQDTAGNPSAAETFSFTVDAASIVLKDGYDNGAVTDDNIISVINPRFVLSGFTGNITATATKTGSSLTTQRSGDGEISFDTDLTDGEWTITATGSGSPAKSATLTFTVQEDLPTLALKNFDQSQHSNVRNTVTVVTGGVTRQRAQSFITGDIPYFVKQVQFEVVSTNITTGSMTTTVEIRADNNGSPASTALASTTVSDSVLTTSGIKTATFTTAQKLDPNTTYHIVLNFALVGSSTKVISLRIRNPGQDAESISEWSVGGRAQQKTSISVWGNAPGDADTRFSIGIYGYYAPFLRVFDSDGIRDDNVSAPGFQAATAYGFFSKDGPVTITATKQGEVPEAERIAADTFGGYTEIEDGVIELNLVTTGAFSINTEGDWTMSASNGTDTTPTVTQTISQNPPTILIANTEQTTDSVPVKINNTNASITADDRTLQGFTTGGNAYFLKEVEFEVITAAADDTGSFTVSVVGEGSDGNPSSTALASVALAHDVVETTGVKTAIFTTPARLSANTTYYIQFEYQNSTGSNNGDPYIADTTADDEDSGGVTGWSIADVTRFYSTIVSRWGNGGHSLQIKLTGERASDVDLKASSDTGAFIDDDLTGDSTPTVILTGFRGDITVTADHATAADVTASKTGDGEVDLGKLADGEWSITATDGIRTSVPLVITVQNDLPGRLVSNVEETVDSSGLALSLATTRQAVPFTTPAGVGYTAAGVRYGVHTAAPDKAGTFKISIQGPNNNLPNGTELAAVTVDHDVVESTGVKTATFSSPLDLTASTTYWLVFDFTAADALDVFGLTRSSTTNEDSTSISGWSLGDNGAYYSSSAWTTASDNKPLHIALLGALTPNHSVDLHADSDSGRSDTDNLTNDNTPTVTVSGFDDSTTVTITATHSDGTTTKTVSRTGNGDATFHAGLGALSPDGVWSLVATDGTLVSPALSITIDTESVYVVPSVQRSFLGHLNYYDSDLYINKADADDTSAAIFVSYSNLPNNNTHWFTVLVNSSTTCDGTLTYTGAGPVTSDVSSDGVYKICIKSEDRAGNTSYNASPTFTRDTAVPVISSFNPPTGTAVTSTPQITFSSSEAGVTRAHAACNIEAGVTVASGTNTFTFPHLTNKTYSNCSFVVEDAAGNPSAAETFSFTVDAASIVLKDGEDDGAVTDDNKLSQSYPAFVLDGFTGTVNATATKTGSQDAPLTKSRSGDGELVFDNALTDGEWTISATGSGTPPKTATLVITTQEDLPTVALKNIGQSQHSDDRTTMTLIADGTTNQRAQSFTTGDIPYFVKQVQFEVVSTNITTNSVTSTVEIRADNNGSPASTALVSTAVSDSVLTTRGIKTATFTTAQKLDPNTTYHVVLNFAVSGSSAKSLSLRIRNPGQDAESISGWSVGGRAQQKTSSSVWDNLSGDANRRLSIGIYGNNAPSIQIRPNADTGIKGDGITSVTGGDLWFVLRGFRKTGNGDVTLTARSDTHSCSQSYRCSIRQSFYHIKNTITLSLGPSGITQARSGVWTLTATNGEQTATRVVTIIPNPPSLLASNLQQTTGKGNAALITSNTPGSQAVTGYAQPFSTGDNYYALEKVQYEVTEVASALAQGDTGSFTVSVVEEGSDGGPSTTTLVSKVEPHSAVESTGVKTTTFATPLNLQPNKTYYVVFKYQHSQGGAKKVKLAYVTVGTDDAGGVSGWSIEDISWRFITADQWQRMSNTRAFNIALTGSRVPTIDLKASSDTGRSDDDDLTSDTTPTLVLKGFYGDITITATHATASNVTASRTGDGEVDLAELADGEWTLTATDGTRTATLTITVNRDLPIFIVGNTEQTPQSLGPELGKGNFSSKVALTVTTGTTPYTVENVRFRISSEAADNDGTFTVTIESDSSGLPDGTPLATAIVPHDEIETTGVKTATFARPLDLAASTTYHIVFSYVPAGTQSIQVGAVNSDDEDDNSLAGWSLGNGNTYYDGSWTTGTISQEVSLYGYSTLAHSVKLHADSDTGSTVVDNITNDTTPKVTVAGFDNNQTVTITATKGNLTKTATRTGNGDATFASGQALSSEGVWSLVATDGTLTSRPLRITIDTTAPTIPAGIPAFNPNGALSNTDLYINKADWDQRSNTAFNPLLSTLTDPDGAVYWVEIFGSGSCDSDSNAFSGLTRASQHIVEVSDITSDSDNLFICLALRDTAGNIAYRASPVFTRDISVPVISATTFPSGTINDATPNISFTSSEAGTTRAHAACNIGELAVASGTNTFTIPQLTSKAYTNCSLIVEDAAGNPSAEQTFSFTVDAGTIALEDGYDDGIDTSDNRISTIIPRFVVSGFGGTVTLSAQKTGGGPPTTNTRTGDGDVFLNLEEGEWTISVSDDQSPSKSTSIVITIDEELPALILKNFGQTDTSNRITLNAVAGGKAQTAQPFSTGSVPYYLKQVQFEISNAASDDSGSLVVAVHADNNGSPASTALTSVALDHDIVESAGIKTATFATAQKLDPNTPYHIVIIYSRSASGGHLILKQKESGQDSGSLAGWTEGVAQLCTGTFTNCALSNTDKPLSFGIYGYQAPFLTIIESLDTGIKGDKKTKPQAGGVDFVVQGFHLKHGTVTATATKQGATAKTGNTFGHAGRGTNSLVRFVFSLTDATEHGDWEIVATNGTQSLTDTFTIDPNTPTTLVANIQKSVSTTNQATLNATNGKAAAQFTTPTGTTVYTLNEVQYWVKTAAADSNGSFTISVQGENSSLPDGTKIDTVTVNHDDIETAGKKVAVFGSGVDLAAGTNYWLVFEYTPAGSESVVLHTSSATSEDSDGISGWSLGDNCAIYATAWGGCGTGTPLSVGLYGAETSPYKVVLKASSDTGTNNDRVTSDNTPTFTVSGLDNNATVTVTATHTDNTEQSHTKTGNGDITFPSNKSLKDGVWSVVASDGTNSTPRLLITIDTTAPTVPDAVKQGFTGHLTHDTDLYINLADTGETSAPIFTIPTSSAATYTVALVSSSATCHTQTYVATAPQTSDVSSEGDYKICIKAVDLAGNTGYDSTATFTKDVTIPVITNFNSPSGTQYDTTPDITFNASEDGKTRADASCKIPEVAVSASGTNTVAFEELAAGAYGSSCSLVILDAAGNPSAGSAITDFTVADVGINITMDNSAWSTSREVTATITGSSPTNTVWALIDPSTQTPEVCDSSTTFPNGQTYTSGTAFTATSDEADNGKQVCFKVTVSGNDIYRASSAIAKVDSTDPVLALTFETRKSGGSATAFTTATADVFLTTGETFKITDASTDTGGSGIDTKTLTTHVGTQEQHDASPATAPAVTASGTANTGPWTYTVAAGDKGILKYTYTIADEAGNTATATVTLDNLLIDTAVPTAPVVDLNTASDTGSSDTDNITKDDTPDFTITNDSARVKQSGGVDIDEDNGKSAEVIEWHMTAAGGNSFTKQTGATHTFTPASALTDGVYKIKAAFIDKAGNKTESAVVTFTIDTTAPTAKPVTPDLGTGSDTGVSNTDNITNDQTPTISTTTTADSYEWTINNTVNSTYTTRTFNPTFNTDGRYTFSVKALDIAGNASPASDDLTITIDTARPAAVSDIRFARIGGDGKAYSGHTGVYFYKDAIIATLFIPQSSAGDLGGYKVHYVKQTTATDTTCPAKSVSSGSLTSLSSYTSDSISDFKSGGVTEGKWCIYVEQSDIAGNRAISVGKVVYVDRTAPVVSGVTINLADAYDSTRQEVAADAETDNDDIWNPGKTDDRTKETSVTIEVSGIPADTIMGALRPVKVVLKGGTRDATIGHFTPTASTSNRSFTSYTLSVGTGDELAQGKANNLTVEVYDAAENKTTTTAKVVTVDTKTSVPLAPRMNRDTDTGLADNDGYTNAEYIDFIHSGPGTDTDPIYRMYTWVDAGAVPNGEVEASELTVLQQETSPDDDTEDLVDIEWGLTGGLGGIRENIVLPEGTHKIVTGQIDKAGNDEVYSAPLTIHIDRTPPAAPTAPTLNSADDSGAERPGAEKAENNVYRTDGITRVYEDLSFFGCVDPSDIRVTNPGTAATVTAVVRDSTDTVVTDSGTTNKGTSGRTVTFGDTLTTAGGDVVRPSICPDGLFPYKLDLDETYGTANRTETYTVKMKATDLAGNVSEEGAATTIVIDRQLPSDSLGDIYLDTLTDNGTATNDNITSLTDLLYTTNKHSVDNNGAPAYQARTHKTLSHYEIGLQRYGLRLESDGSTLCTDTSIDDCRPGTIGAIFTAPSAEQVTYFQRTTIPAQTINGSQTLPSRTLTGESIAVLVKGLALEFDQYSNTYQTRIRAVDVAGNVRELSPVLSASYLLPPPPITSANLATASDSASGVSGTDADDITNLDTWTFSGSFTYREKNNNPAINTVKARIINTANNASVTTADITTINHGDINGNCADESDSCSETDDVDSTFTHTFDLSEMNLADGVYRVEFQTYDGSEGGATTPVVVTYDTTPPSTDGLLESMTVYIAIRNSTLTKFDIRATKPQKGDFKVYATDGTTALVTDVRDVQHLVGPFVRLTGAALRPNFDYEFSITDAAGNESERVALPQAPNISIVRLGDSTPVQYAAVALTHADATDFLQENNDAYNFGHYTTQTALTTDCNFADDATYPAYTAGSAVELSGGDTRVCFRYGHILEGAAMEIVKDTQGAPDFASLSLHADDDTTISTYTTNKNAFTSTQRPRINGSSLPETPVRIYRVTDAQFTAATTGSEWSELAVDANKVFDGTSHSTDGSFSVPAPSQALAEGVYHIAARISLDSGGTYTDAAQVFTLTIDTTAPGKQPNTPVLKTSSDDTGTAGDGITKTNPLTITHATALATGEELFTCYSNGEKVSEHYQTRDCSITFSEDGTYSITTTVTDNAGNESPHSDPLSVTIDTTDPDITIIRLFDTDTNIDSATRFIAVAGDLTTLAFKVVEETKSSCDSRTSDANTAYVAGTQFDPNDSSTDGYCFVVTDLAGNRATLHTTDAIEGVGSFTIEGGTEEGGTVYTTSGAKTITGISAPEAKVLIKIADATDDPATYAAADRRNTSFATTSFDIPTGQTTFERTLSISAGDNGKKVVGWIWTDATDSTTATPAITLTTLTVDNTKPVVTPGTITSDNTNPAFAKQGNTITATFTTSEAIKTHTTMVNGITATCTDTNNSFSCTASLTNTAVEGVATVTTTVTDKAGNTTTHTFRNQNITVDATAPEVAITGLASQHFKGTGEQSFTLTITDTNQISPGTYTFTATGGTLATCQIIVPATSSQETATCTITTASGTNGTPITLAIPLLADASGNTKTAHSQILGYIDTAAPTIDSIDTLDDTEKKKLTLTLTATHNQHASNTSKETLTPVFSGDCSKFDARANWKGTTTHQYTATFSVPKGTYKTCTLALRDEAGNSSATQTLAEFSIKGGGGIASIGGAVSRMFTSVSDIFDGGGQDDVPAVQSDQQDTDQTEPLLVETPVEQEQDTPLFTLEFARDLTIGSVGEDVRALQKLLNSRGFTVSDSGAGSPGEESTYFGEKTQAALIRYQEANGITPASGYFGPITRAYMQEQQEVSPTTPTEPAQDIVSPIETEQEGETPDVVEQQGETPIFTLDLTIGSVSEEVRALQVLLNSLGYIVSETGPGSPGQESTYFGEKTQAALIRYQQANGIEPASGYFGPITRAYIQGQQGSDSSEQQDVGSFIETNRETENREEVRAEVQQVEPQSEQEQVQEPQAQTEPAPQQIEEVQAFVETVDDTEEYEPITDILYRVRQPSFGAPSF